MTNLTTINLTTLKSTELKELAKEFKVKNWWLLNKNNLINALVEIKLDLEDKAAVEEANLELQKEQEKSPLTEDEEYCHYCGTRKKKGFLCPECGRDWAAPKDSGNSTQTQGKGTKAPKAKTPKAPKVEKNEENLVTLKELAAEFKMKGTKARRLLRNETAARPFGGNRWEWDRDLHKEALEVARAILKTHIKAPKEEQTK